MSTAGTWRDPDFRSSADLKTARYSGGCCCQKCFYVPVRSEWWTFRCRPANSDPSQLTAKLLLSSYKNGSRDHLRIVHKALLRVKCHCCSWQAPQPRTVFPNLPESASWEGFPLLTGHQQCSPGSTWPKTSFQKPQLQRASRALSLLALHPNTATWRALRLCRSKSVEKCKQGLARCHWGVNCTKTGNVLIKYTT